MPSEVAFASMDLPRVWKKDAPVGLLLLSHSEGQGPEAERRGVVASGVYVMKHLRDPQRLAGYGSAWCAGSRHMLQHGFHCFWFFILEILFVLNKMSGKAPNRGMSMELCNDP